MKKTVFVLLGAFAMCGAGCPNALAWDYTGHRIVNQLALASLPDDFPDFAKTPAARERIAFLGGEADRWRNTTDLPLKHFNSPDHFLDFEELADYGMRPETLSPFRYEFTARMAVARALEPEKFKPIDPAQNRDRMRQLPGFLPWTITEYQAKLKSGFSYLKVYEELGTPQEIANARQNIIYIMGMMGHFVGDGAQPLHTTHHYNGWVGENPEGFTTNRGIHSWIDGGYIGKTGINTGDLLGRVRLARELDPGPGNNPDSGVFRGVMAYLGDQFEKVRPLYELEKEGGFTGEGEKGLEGRRFIENQLLAGGQMLGDLWLTAWKQAHPDGYLRDRLTGRREPSGGSDGNKP